MADHEIKVDAGTKVMTALAAVAIVATLSVFLHNLYSTINKNSVVGEVDQDKRDALIMANLAPIGQVKTGDVKVELRSGEQVYTSVCTACHATGVLQAPKADSNADWAPRIAAGWSALWESAVNGKGAMPARGGDPSLSDYELSEAIVYMAKTAGHTLSSPVQAPEDEATEEEAPSEEATEAAGDGAESESPEEPSNAETTQ